MSKSAFYKTTSESDHQTTKWKAKLKWFEFWFKSIKKWIQNYDF